ncbi:hypothetical protein ACFLU6_01855 [Acidobacteriota bacterium]
MKRKKRAIFLLMLLLMSTSICTTNRKESICKDPIDEDHRGLQWLSKGPLGQHLAIDFVADTGTEVRAIADGYIEHNYPNLGFYGGCDGTPGPSSTMDSMRGLSPSIIS